MFDAFAGYAVSTMNLTGAGDAERLTAFAVTPDFWNEFSNPIAAGRACGDNEENHDARVVVLSNALWRDRVDAKADIVGQDILLNGIGIAAATQTLGAVAAWQAKTWPDNHHGLSARVQLMRESLSGKFQQPLAMLLIASLLVLVIASAHLGNLMLSRGQTRGREFALRRALGADARNVVGTVLAEAAVIAAVGATIGLARCSWLSSY